MNKKLIILLLCLNITNILAQDQYEQVSIDKVVAAIDGNGQVSLKFTLSVPSNTLVANDVLMLTPILIAKDGSEQHALSPIYACGRVSDLSFRRKRAFLFAIRMNWFIPLHWLISLGCRLLLLLYAAGFGTVARCVNCQFVNCTPALSQESHL